MQRHAAREREDDLSCRVSRRAQDIQPFLVMDVLERAQTLERETHMDVIHLEVGEPDFPTPDCIV
ncbi:MAG: hypothetical protein ACREOH_05175, partial [Candidatus Entotheonellia bacterium]